VAAGLTARGHGWASTAPATGDPALVGASSGSGSLVDWQPGAGWGALARPRKILEIFLRGGASLYSSFWNDNELGGPDGTKDTKLGVADWACITGDRTLCTGTRPGTTRWEGDRIGRAGEPLFSAIAAVGGATYKLADHMRVIRVGHDLLPHEAAIPYAATGTRLGRPIMSGLGAAIWRFREQQGAAPGVYSLILRAGNFAHDRLAARYLSSYGPHGAAYKPPVIPLGDRTFYDALERSANGLTATDDLKRFYRNRYEDALRHGGKTVRSEGWSSYAAALDLTLTHAEALHTTLSPHVDLLFPDPPITAPDYNTSNLTRNAIRAAIDLLADTASDAPWHVAVIDGGVEYHYDTHNEVSAATGTLQPKFIQNGNIWNLCDTLASRKQTLLSEGIAVFIHTEFGRKETTGGNSGTEHHPGGYANVVIDDLIVAPGFVGEKDLSDDSLAICDVSPTVCDDGTGSAAPLTPTDVHAAVLQLAGIDPYASELLEDEFFRVQGVQAAGGGSAADYLLGIA
jgi:hypothetical protein